MTHSIHTDTIPSMYDGAEIVDIKYVKDPGGENSAWFNLSIETKCSFHLAQQISIPDDPKIFGQVDIPAYDDRNVADWLEQVKQSALSE